MKLGFLGPKGTFSHEAGLKIAKESELVSVSSIPALFLNIGKKYDRSLVPVENSTGGTVITSIDELMMFDYPITLELETPIIQNLITNKDNKDIKVIKSHPQAILQSKVFLKKNYPDILLENVNSSALAVKELKTGEAAIGSKISAKIFDKRIVSESINTPGNFTRFVVIGGKRLEISGNDKTSLVFRIRHIPVSLSRVLKVFSDNDLNLTMIISRPIVGIKWEYNFWIDLECHFKDASFRKALKNVRELTTMLVIKGSYPKG